MDQHQKILQQKGLLDVTLGFIKGTSGLSIRSSTDMTLEVAQNLDQKTIALNFSNVDEVLTRQDSHQRAFLQINFQNGKKLLITDTLFGFKPVLPPGVAVDKLPKVVTTSDMVSVIEAIEEALVSPTHVSEIDTLKKIYAAIVTGAENVGFDCCAEREWLRCMPMIRATA